MNKRLRGLTYMRTDNQSEQFMPKYSQKVYSSQHSLLFHLPRILCLRLFNFLRSFSTIEVEKINFRF